MAEVEEEKEEEEGPHYFRWLCGGGGRYLITLLCGYIMNFSRRNSLFSSVKLFG